jgi:Flp pilus assembly protein TadG
MGKRKVFGTLIRRTEGSVAVITAIALVALLGMVSLAVDMGQLYTVRNELQNSADAAALAGAGSLIQDYGAGAVRDAAAATQAAMTVAQRQSELSGQPAVADGDRNDLTITFGAWNLNAGDPATAWTEIGPTCSSTSNANAVMITMQRGSNTVYGPVTNLFAGIMGFNTSEVKATAIAYLGYTNEVQGGGVQVPLALPTTGQYSPLASSGQSGWFASLFGPKEAVASATKTFTFRDTGGANVASNVPTSPTANLDPNQGYWYTGSSSNSVPTTITNTLAKIYTPSLSGSSSAPAVMTDLKVGQQVYPRSEYCWGRNYIGPIFENLQKAYNYKTTGSATTAPAAGTPWRTTMVVHGLMSTASLPQKTGFMSLARLLAPFWASEAYACATISYPTVKVSTVVNVDIIGVTFNKTTSDDGNYTYPKTIATPVPATGTTTYTNKKDFLNRYPNSTWNLNTATIRTVTDASTISPPGSFSGGPSNNTVNPGAPTTVGSFATVPCLVK